MEIGHKLTVIPPIHIHLRDSRTDGPDAMYEIITQKGKHFPHQD